MQSLQIDHKGVLSFTSLTPNFLAEDDLSTV